MQQDSQNLDSLVDTMSCVVGILVVILAVTLVNIGVVIQPPEVESGITPELLRDAEREAQRIRQLLEELRRRWAGLEGAVPQQRTRFQGLQDLIAELERELQQPLPAGMETSKLEDLVGERDQQVQNLEQRIEEAQKKLARLKASLAKAPSEPPRPKTVHLPNPRPVPQDATPILFYCRYGRLIQVDPEVLALGFGFLNNLSEERRLSPGDITELSMLEYLLDENVLGDDTFRWRLHLAGTGTSLRLELQQRGAGETASEIEASSSAYQRRINSVRRTNHFALFLVWSDSFEVYVAARSILSGRLDAGWLVLEPSDEFEQNIFMTASVDRPLDLID